MADEKKGNRVLASHAAALVQSLTAGNATPEQVSEIVALTRRYPLYMLFMVMDPIAVLASLPSYDSARKIEAELKAKFVGGAADTEDAEEDEEAEATPSPEPVTARAPKTANTVGPMSDAALEEMLAD